MQQRSWFEGRIVYGVVVVAPVVHRNNAIVDAQLTQMAKHVGVVVV